MRILISVIVLMLNFSLSAQRTILPTDSIKISGKVKSEKSFSIADLEAFPKTDIGNQVIYNHKREIKDTLLNMKGVLLKTVLNSMEYIYSKPKELNEFYFVFIASDGYKVVFSWNEIYNTEAGNKFFIITELNGKKIKDMEYRISFISTADLQAGRRYIKALQRIEVKQL